MRNLKEQVKKALCYQKLGTHILYIGSTYHYATFGLGAIILHEIEGQNMLTGRPGASNL